MYNARGGRYHAGRGHRRRLRQVIGSKFVLYLQKKKGQRLRRPAEVR